MGFAHTDYSLAGGVKHFFQPVRDDDNCFREVETANIANMCGVIRLFNREYKPINLHFLGIFENCNVL